MAFMDTLNSIAKNVGDKTSGTIELTKLQTKISAQRRIINEAEQNIGAYYYKKFAHSDNIDEEVAVYFQQIDEVQALIDEMQARIEELREVAEKPLDPSKKLCSNCGAVISVKAKFCSECGAPNLTVAPAEEDASEVETVVEVVEVEEEVPSDN